MDGISKCSFDAIHDGPLLKVMLDTVIENKIGTNLKVCEVGAAEGKMFSRAVPLLSLYPVIQLSYTATDKTEDLVAAITEVASDDTIEVCTWDVAKKPPAGVNKSDLVIASNLIHQTSDLSNALENIKLALEPRGFLLLHEVTASLGGGHWGVPNTAISQKISTNTVIPQEKSANTAIPHRKSMKYRNRQNLVYYSHYALQLTRRRGLGFSFVKQILFC